MSNFFQRICAEAQKESIFVWLSKLQNICFYAPQIHMDVYMFVNKRRRK